MKLYEHSVPLFNLVAFAQSPLQVFVIFQVHDGGSVDAPVLGRFCGPDLPAPVSSSQNLMYLLFESDGSVQNHGFKATYQTAQGVAGKQSGRGIQLSECINAAWKEY